jgi:hypothetical protein
MADPIPIKLTFDPSRYLTKVGGSDYLEVKWRVVWLRHDHPDATIETELVDHEAQMAVFRARVSIPGGGSATGYGSETYNDFRDYLEKSETKALGRALAALGYGTQFCPDFDFGADRGQVVDSPVDRRPGRAGSIPPQTGSQPTPIDTARKSGYAPRVTSGRPLTEKQFGKALAECNERGIDDDGRHALTRHVTGKASLNDLTSQEASKLIDFVLTTDPEELTRIAGEAKRQAAVDRGQTELPAAETASGEPSDPNAWTTLWRELEAAGVPRTGPDRMTLATDLVGFWDQADPARMLAALRQQTAAMPAQGTLTDRVKAGRDGEPGQDRWSN